MGPKCKAKTNKGEPCQAWAQGEAGYCFVHDPARSAERAAARKLGGHNRRAPKAAQAGGPPEKIRTMGDVLELLDCALADCWNLENSIARGRLIVAMAGEYIKALQVGEMEARLAALEMALKSREAK